MSGMRERLARALCNFHGDWLPDAPHVGGKPCWQLYLAEVDAILAELREPTPEMVEALRQETPFVHRRKMDKSGYEVIEQKHPDWREVIAEPMEVRGEFESSDKAYDLYNELEAAWRFTAAIDAIKGEGK